MYAVVRSGGKQYKVSEGDVIRVERLEGDVGSSISLNEVLLVGDGETLTIGKPLVGSAEVTAEIVGHGRAKKITIYKMKRRKNYRRTQGHRQNYTALKIQAIRA